MSRKIHFLIFFLVVTDFSFFWNIDAESTYLFSPNENEVEECKKDVSKCSNFSTYPRSFIENLIKKNLIKKEWFSGDKGEQPYLNVLSENETRSSNLCQTTSTTVYPQGKFTINGEFVYIVQMHVDNDYYYQPLKTATCHQGSNCSVVDHDSPNQTINLTSITMDFKCLQEKHTLSVIGVTLTGKVVRVQVLENCCCICKWHYK